jgi:hypothetical protein
MDETKTIINDKFDSIDLSENDESTEESHNDSITKLGGKKKYKERKLEHKLNKYEAIIKKIENINRVTSSQVILKIIIFNKKKKSYF